MKFFVKVPGSCGELIQGRTQEGPFLVTCPIDLYSTVEVSNVFHGTLGLGSKAKQALANFKSAWGMRLTSDLPQGKGMASSSADIAAVLAARQYAMTGQINARQILAQAVQIEPTDGIFLPGIVSMNPRTGKKLASYGTLPAWRISIFDTGGTVNTEAFYQRQKKLSTAAENLRIWQGKQLLAWWEQGIQQKNLHLLGKAITQSALWNQKLLYKKNLEAFSQMAIRFGAFGVNVAHSGTVVGVFWPSDVSQQQLDQSVSCLQQKFSSFQFYRQVHLQSGGIFIQPAE